MNKFYLFFLTILLSMPFAGNAQILLSESFDNSGFPPTGWTRSTSSGFMWTRITSSSWPSGITPHSGAGMAMFNSFTYSSGSTELVTPVINFTTSSGVKVVSFWMYRESGYNSSGDRVETYINTTPSSSGGTLLGTVNRAMGLTPTASSAGWAQYSFQVPSSFAGATNYIIFKAVTAWGYDTHFDDVSVENFIPCGVPTSPVTSGLSSTNATISWTAVSGSFGYQYVLNTTATDPASTAVLTTQTANTKSFTGLTPNTTYYMHVRNKCNSGGTGFSGISNWVNYAFTTYPPCTAPSGFMVNNLTPNSATVSWKRLISASSYDYIVDQSMQTPGASTGAVNTIDSSASLTGLNEDTWYYVHIKANCAGGEISPWSLDSFKTPIPCRKPQVTIDYINTDQAVASWPIVPTATYYEYAIKKTSSLPDVGTKIEAHSQLLTALLDGQQYYIFVRSHCNSLNIIGESDWSMASFKTFPLSVNDMNNNAKGIAVYPNPVKDLLTIKLSGKAEANAMVIVTDMTGKLVTQSQLKQDETNVDFSSVAPGIYLVKYTSGTYHEVIKIVKE
ncbi:MAG: T9SS type A sorting domain-containing protein [Sphingobacteriales bacterium]|nr:MAG: T9SS type A sorting domain-containing protein [Sphingobacteriales bacterium]